MQGEFGFALSQNVDWNQFELVHFFINSLPSRCKVAVYCENRHRREDKERHDKICKSSTEKIPSKVLGRSHLAEEVPYKLVEIEGKGRGLVATKTMEVGELVLSEKAFLKVPSEASLEFYKGFFSRLEPDIRAKLMNLSCPEDTELKDQTLLMKFNANCIAMTHSERKNSVVFEMISMINHSCMPNVVWFPEEADETRKEVRVCRRIQKGEEIVASYSLFSDLPLRQQRRDRLRPWGFLCRLSFLIFHPFSHQGVTCAPFLERIWRRMRSFEGV